MRKDRIVAAAFVVLVCTAIIGFSAGSTSASFTASTTNPGQSWATSNVAAPASVSATSAAAGQVNLSWPATTTPANGHTVTYLVLRNGTQITSTPSLTYSDTPSADGTYSYTVQTKIAQGAGFFTSGSSPAASGLSDRTAPTMSILCNGGSCTGNANGWFNVAVTAVSSGTDAGTGMASVTTSMDGAANGTTAGSSRTDTVSGDSSSHTVAYFGTDVAGNVSGTTTQTIKIDTTAPTAASGLIGGTGFTAGTVILGWTAGTDALSGLAGYTIHRTNVVGSCPAANTTNYPNAMTIGAVTNATVGGMVSNSKYCFYLTTTDNAGNVSVASNVAGPYKAK